MSSLSVLIGGVGIWFVASPGGAAMPYLLTSAVLHVVYMMCLAWSYKSGDSGQVYPIARGVSPLLVTSLGILGVGEIPSVAGLIGLAFNCAGLLSLATAGYKRRGSQWAALAPALATGIAIASYTVVDGIGVQVSESVAGYAVWLQLMMGVSFVAVVGVQRRRGFGLDPRTWVVGLGGGVVAVFAYTLVLVRQP